MVLSLTVFNHQTKQNFSVKCEVRNCFFAFFPEASWKESAAVTNIKLTCGKRYGKVPDYHFAHTMHLRGSEFC